MLELQRSKSKQLYARKVERKRAASGAGLGAFSRRAGVPVDPLIDVLAIAKFMRLRPNKKLGQGSPIAEEPPTADDKDEQTEPQADEHDEDFWKDGRLALGEDDDEEETRAAEAVDLEAAARLVHGTGEDGLEAEESAGESDHDPLAMPTALLPDFMDGIEAAARLAEQDALEIDLDGVNSKE